MDALALIALLKKHGLQPPKTLTVAITGACNLHCAHCWVDAGCSASASWVPTQSILSRVEEFAVLGGTAVRLTGGEPLLHPDWHELLRFAAATGLKPLLQTNGMLFDDDNLCALQALKLVDLRIQISLDGATVASHDLVRGAGAYVQVLQALRRLCRYGFGPALELCFTEMRHNLHELPDVLLLAEQLGVASVSSGCLVACGRASADPRIAPASPEQYLSLLQRHAADAQFRRRYEQLGHIAALEWCTDNATRQGCTFSKNPYLSAQGVLYPCLLCHADPYSVTGVFEKGLFAALIEGVPLWSALQQLSQQRIAMIEACQVCALLQSCAGGCMGRVWGSFGEFMRVEDRCQQRQAVMRWKEKR